MKQSLPITPRRPALLDVAVPGLPTLASLQATLREALARTRNHRRKRPGKERR